MKIAYYPETDSMYIDLSAKASAESREVSPGVVIDYAMNGNTMIRSVTLGCSPCLIFDPTNPTNSSLPKFPS